MKRAQVRSLLGIVQVAALAGVLLGSLTGCWEPAGGAAAGPNASGSRRPRACLILTEADAESLVGAPVKVVKDEFSPDRVQTITRCWYSAVSGSRYVAIDIHLSPVVGRPDVIEGFRRLYSKPGQPAVEVPGLGDLALYGDRQLAVFRGSDTRILVTTMGFGDAKAKEVAIQVGGKALKQL